MDVNPYLIGRTRYRVLAPVVVARLSTCVDQYVKQGAFLPLGVMPTQIESMLKDGMIEKFEAAS